MHKYQVTKGIEFEQENTQGHSVGLNLIQLEYIVAPKIEEGDTMLRDAKPKRTKVQIDLSFLATETVIAVYNICFESPK